MYSLWDWRSVDPVAMSTDLDELLDIVREGIERNGKDDTEHLALVYDEMPSIPPTSGRVRRTPRHACQSAWTGTPGSEAPYPSHHRPAIRGICIGS